MAEQRKCKKLVAVLVEHQEHFGVMSDENCQWAIQNPKDAITLFAEAVKNRTAVAIKKLLERLSVTIALPTVNSFTANEHFVVNTSAKTKVKISWLGDNFKKHFLPKVEESAVVAEELAVHKLLKASYDPAIITALGDEAKVEVTLGQFFAAFAKQPHGEDGSLLTNGYVNVGYVRDIKCVLWAVRGFWSGGGWRFEASSLDYPRRWDAGHQFLSR